MIIWINGAFGSGKTQTATELVKRGNNLHFYDPELIGFFLKKQYPSGLMPPDFQDIPMWRTFNYEILYQMAVSFQGNIVVPMTITNVQYFDEIVTKLRENGIEVKHFILCASAATLQRRLQSRLDGKNSWAALQIERCMKAFENELTEGKIDTENLSVSETAERIAAECGVETAI